MVADDAESLRVRQAARQALDSAEAAATAAREALEQGDNATAGRRLGELLEIQPEHPAVADLTGQLNDSFRPQAEAARVAMRRSEADAGRLGASGNAVARASTLSREGGAAFSRREYAVAAERFMSARDAFARAGRAASTQAAAEAAAAKTAAAKTAAAKTAAAEAARMRAAQEAADRTRAAEEATARARAQPPPTAARPAAAPPAAPRVAAPAPAPGPSDNELIRALVDDYERAIETRDLDLFRRIKPNLSSDEENRLRQAFQAGRQNVNIEILELDVSDDTARVRLVRRDSVNGDFLPPFKQLLSLRKTGRRLVHRIDRPVAGRSRPGPGTHSRSCTRTRRAGQSPPAGPRCRV